MNANLDAGKRIFETVSDGGVGIFRTDVGYAIVGQTAPAIERIFTHKNRSYNKPCGCFGSLEMFSELIDCSELAREFVRVVVVDHGLPLSIVGRYRANHPIIANADPFVVEHGTKGGTIDLLMNVGPIHDEIARRALESGRGVFGSSANMSLSGSKYSFESIEPKLRNAVDTAIDGGATLYSNPDGLGSSIIDLDTFRPFRIGVKFEEICAIAKAELDIDIPALVTV
jgi:tRNA A37 threonylcarbamoyladenosine synthetase subunit TsaC/SUA5/YrdC